MLSVRRADVHGLNVAAAKNGAVVGGRVLHAESVRQRACLLDARAGHGRDVDEPEPTHGFEVDTPHETGSNDGRFDAFHSGAKGYIRTLMSKVERVDVVLRELQRFTEDHVRAIHSDGAEPAGLHGRPAELSLRTFCTFPRELSSRRRSLLV